ncbi:MAG: beta-hydroxyacyl-ACP dehydratase [Nitrospirota bacterium]
MSVYPPIEMLIPHRPPMMLINGVVGEVEEGLIATALPDPKAWYANEDGSMPAWIGIELMAQAISAWAGLQAYKAGMPPRKGFLIGTREYMSKCPSFTAGNALFIEVRKVFSDPQGLAAFNCLIRDDRTVFAEAVVKVINVDNYEAAMAPSGKSYEQ